MVCFGQDLLPFSNWLVIYEALKSRLVHFRWKIKGIGKCFYFCYDARTPIELWLENQVQSFLTDISIHCGNRLGDIWIFHSIIYIDFDFLFGSLYDFWLVKRFNKEQTPIMWCSLFHLLYIFAPRDQAFIIGYG